jgi:hypothetical protein
MNAVLSKSLTNHLTLTGFTRRFALCKNGKLIRAYGLKILTIRTY